MVLFARVGYDRRIDRAPSRVKIPLVEPDRFALTVDECLKRSALVVRELVAVSGSLRIAPLADVDNAGDSAVDLGL